MSSSQKTVVTILWVFVSSLVFLAFAWIPMLCWNHALVVLFPAIPKITYMQAFALVLLASFFTGRPQFNTVERA